MKDFKYSWVLAAKFIKLHIKLIRRHFLDIRNVLCEKESLINVNDCLIEAEI